MSKYAPLGDYLRDQPMSEVPMSFSDIEKVLGTALPPRAQNHQAWWSNSTTNNTMTKIWLDAGFKTERVDVGGRRLVFRRQAGHVGGGASIAAAAVASSAPASCFLDRLRARLSGTVTIRPGVDLTAPDGEPWYAQSD